MLKKVISGGQTGADISGVEIAKKHGFETGGTLPYGFKTLNGNRPEYAELFGMVAHESISYVPRTRKNVEDADGTIRLAYNFYTPGELCTKKAINDYKKPYIDIYLPSPIPVSDVISWIKEHNIETLNVAGNSEKTHTGTYEAASKYLDQLFTQYKNELLSNA